MRFRYEFMSLTQIGEIFGVSSHVAGRWLTAIGLRYESKQGKRPSGDAHAGGYVKDVPSKGQGYMWAWHAEKTVKALEKAGHKVALRPGHELLAPCRLHGPFEARQGEGGVYEIHNGDGTAAVHVTGEANARVLARLLNAAHRAGAVERLLGTDGELVSQRGVTSPAPAGKAG